jgi:hypothetical protein
VKLPLTDVAVQEVERVLAREPPARRSAAPIALKP